MHIYVFNACLIAAWLLVSLGAGVISLAAGLITAGAVLAAITLFMAVRYGLYTPERKDRA